MEMPTRLQLSAFGTLLAVALWQPAAAQTPDANLQLAPFAAPITPPGQTWNRGLSTSLHLDAETLGVVGGSGERQAISVAAFQAALTLDTAQAGWWQDGQFDFMLMGLRSNGNLESATQTVQLPSNLWAPNFLRLYQLSYRQQIGPGFVQGGIMDVNNTFDTTGVAGHLHNASFGIAPTLTSNANIATFPNPGLGLMGGLDLGSGWSTQAGVWQGDPPGMTGALHRGALWIAEADYSWGEAEHTQGTLKLGAWHLQQSTSAYGPDSDGLYAVNEWRWKDASRREWAAFLQGGWSPAASNSVQGYIGAGVRIQGLNAARPADVLTLGVAQARLNSLPSETVVEAVYSLQLARHLYLQPDIQHIQNPGGEPGHQWVAGLRVHIEH
jgi:porin